jgi:YesN/AraC family two-component response regulator
MKIFIKNMVSSSCKMLVMLELEKLGIKYNIISLGEVDLKENLEEVKKEELKALLEKWNFEILDDKNVIIVERIKTVIIEMVHLHTKPPNTNYSDYISRKLLRDYTYLSNIFSDTEKITIEHFIISHKIEKAKELLMNGDYNITEIATMLNYSSISHFSSQFKKVAGCTPTFFKVMKNKNRISLDSI